MDSKVDSTVIGVCLIMGRPDKSYAIGQVRFKDLAPSGIWDSKDFPGEDLTAPLFGHIPIANKMGKKLFEKNLPEDFQFQDLSELASEVAKKYEALKSSFDRFILSNPSKSKTVAPLLDLKLPKSIDIENPGSALMELGKSSGAIDTPTDSMDILSAMKLATYLLGSWQFCEEQRVARKYLDLDNKPIEIYPESWNQRKAK